MLCLTAPPFYFVLMDEHSVAYKLGTENEVKKNKKRENNSLNEKKLSD